jgi:tripartite-type tricarboxylate transporter receptor subunit TctC
MKLRRRAFLHLATGAAALSAISRTARAQAYPSRPVRIVVSVAAGGVADTLARMIAQWLFERLRQPFIIENRTAAGGNIAAEAVVRAPPDGHTLLQVTAANATNATLYNNLSFNFIHDIAPVAGIYRDTQVMLVHSSVPTETIPEFIAYAKRNPGKINFGSGGIGTVSHVTGELFKMMAGVDMVHVPYRGVAPALTDLVNGQVQILFASPGSSIDFVRTGKLRALATAGTTRSEVLPDIPTVADFLPGFEASVWAGIGAPRNTPAAIVDKLNREINAALADAKVKARMGELGTTVMSGTPADLGKLIVDDTEKWAQVLKFAGLKPE